MIKTSVSTYSFGAENGDDKLGVLGVIDKAAEMGFEGIEFVESGYTNLEKADLLRERCAEKNITPVAFCVGANFAIEDEAALMEEVKRVCGLIDVAEKMGVSLVRHDVAYGAFNRTYNSSYDSAIPYMVKGITEVTKYAEQKGIKTMTENHGFFSQDANRVEKLINAVGHPNFGALVDIGNFMCADEDPAISVGIMAHYAFHVHCKDFYFKPGTEVNPGEGWFKSRGGNYLRGATLGFGQAKSLQTIGILKRSGYDGYMTIEYEGGEHPFWGIKVGLDNLKRFIELG